MTDPSAKRLRVAVAGFGQAGRCHAGDVERRIGKVTSCLDSLGPYTFRCTLIGSEAR